MNTIDKHVHIALVGGQPVPVYIGIRTALDNGIKIDKIVLVCSSSSRPEAKRIMSQFPEFESEGRSEILECSPVNFEEIEQFAKNLKKDYEEWGSITINLTSGTKPWALTFASIFSWQDNIHVIYVEQANLITNIRTKNTTQGKINPQTRFELYGADLRYYNDLDTAFSSEDKALIKDIEDIRKINTYDFSILTNDINIDNLRKGEDSGNSNHYINYFEDGQGNLDYCSIECKSNSCIFYYFKENKAVIKLVRKDNSIYKKEIQSEHLSLILFNSGWFELKTALELRRNPNVKSVWLNCKLTDSMNNPKNELDIVADTGSRLIFVECKTMVYDMTDIDKFRSALKNYGGTSSTGIFVTNDRPTYRTEVRYRHAMEKCKDNDILTFNFSLWRDNPTKYPTLNSIVDGQRGMQNKR